MPYVDPNEFLAALDEPGVGEEVIVNGEKLTLSFRDDFIEVFGSAQSSPSLFGHECQIGSVVEDDTVVARGKSFRVAEVEPSKSSGQIRLILELVTA